MTVTNSTVRVEVWNEVYSLLNTNLTDPESRSSPTWILSAFPNTNKDWSGYPIVIINPVEVKQDRSRYGQGTVQDKELNIPITVYTKKALQIDSICDEVEAIILTNESTFTGEGLNTPILEDGSSDHLEVGGDIVHIKAIVLNLQRR